MTVDITSFTDPSMAMELAMARQFGYFQVGEPGYVGKFTARALHDAVPIDEEDYARFIGDDGAEDGFITLDASGQYVYDRRNSDAGAFSKYLVNAMIVADENGDPIQSYNNPHGCLENPCSLTNAADLDKSLEKIIQYTTFVTADDFRTLDASTIGKDDLINVGLIINQKGNYELDKGIVYSVSLKAAQQRGADQAVMINCQNLSQLFDTGTPRSLALTTSTRGTECAPRSGEPAERRAISFDCFKLDASCRPANRDSTDIETYFGPTAWENWLASIRAHEAPSYSTVNSAGYLGHYQLGIAALETAGYLISGSWRSMGACTGQSVGCRSVTDSVLDDNSNWAGRNSVNSKADYLANKNGCQEDAVRRHSNTHFRYLRGRDKLDLDNANDVGGMLGAAHLRGAGGAKDMRDGTELADANGTFPSTYYVEIGSAVC